MRTIVGERSSRRRVDWRALQRRAEEWMAAQNIKNPAAMTRMLAPGFPGLL
jgi:hypothetical protein